MQGYGLSSRREYGLAQRTRATVRAGRWTGSSTEQSTTLVDCLGNFHPRDNHSTTRWGDPAIFQAMAREVTASTDVSLVVSHVSM